jgi:AcrR family transcriptional regulator
LIRTVPYLIDRSSGPGVRKIPAVGELSDRRARKKLRTRTEVRSAAQRLFDERGFDAVTIADVAAEADVAVQTVFNHFATKEELFFDGRTPWLEGTAASVRDRQPGEPPLTALRRYLVATVGDLVARNGTESRRRFVAAIEASPDLRTHELRLTYEAERRLAETLTEAWAAGASSCGSPVPEDPATGAALVAATWLGVARTLLFHARAQLGAPGSATPTAPVEELADRVFGQLEQGFAPAPAGCDPAVTGWPGRRAG